MSKNTEAGDQKSEVGGQKSEGAPKINYDGIDDTTPGNLIWMPN